MNSLKQHASLPETPELPADLDRDAELFAKGDPEAFERLVKQSQQVFTDFVARRTKHNPDAEDIVSMVETTLWLKREEFKGGYKDFVQWGIFTLGLRVKDWWRARIAARKHEEPAAEEREIPTEAEVDGEAWECRQEMPDVAWGMSQLPERTREVILRRIDDEPWRDIADEMQLSKSRVCKIHEQGIAFLLQCVLKRRRERAAEAMEKSGPQRSVLRADSGTCEIEPGRARTR